MSRLASRFVSGSTASRPRCGEWQEIARKAEALGYRHADRPGSLRQTVRASSRRWWRPAAVTSRLRLATLVLDNDFRHPAALAKEAATVDVLTQGRLELGLGAGWLQADYAKTGLPFDPPARASGTPGGGGPDLQGVLRAARSPSRFTGKHYRIENLDASPRPIQRPRPPLMIGGRQRRMLSLAAREADIVGHLAAGSARAGPAAAADVRAESRLGARGCRRSL